jgi:glutathione S-transferase
MYHLYFSPGMCSVAPHIVLEEIGEPYSTELVRVDIASKAEKLTDPAYLAINPKGRVPALKIGDRILTETHAILMFLARRHPEAKLLPTDPEAEARCHEWLAWAASSVHAVALSQLSRPQRFSIDPKDFPNINAKGRQNLDDGFTYIEKVLQGRDWAVPGGFTIADPYLLFFYRVAQKLGFPVTEQFPAWTKITERVVERPAVARILAKEATLK